MVLDFSKIIQRLGGLNMIKKYEMNFSDGIRIKYVINLILFTFTIIRFIEY